MTWGSGPHIHATASWAILLPTVAHQQRGSLTAVGVAPGARRPASRWCVWRLLGAVTAEAASFSGAMGFWVDAENVCSSFSDRWYRLP